MKSNAVIFDNVAKSFGDKKVLENFSCVLNHGSSYCIMGESGRGKTTVLNLLMGLQSPDNGSISGVPDRLSAVFQEDRLCEDYSALGNVIAVTGKAVSKRDILALLAELGLEGNENVPVSTLSGGMRRRVALARALLAEGDMVLLDEPFTGLDDETKALTIQAILKYTKGKTLVVVTHDAPDADMLGAEILRI